MCLHNITSDLFIFLKSVKFTEIAPLWYVQKAHRYKITLFLFSCVDSETHIWCYKLADLHLFNVLMRFHRATKYLRYASNMINDALREKSALVFKNQKHNSVYSHDFLCSYDFDLKCGLCWQHKPVCAALWYRSPQEPAGAWKPGAVIGGGFLKIFSSNWRFEIIILMIIATAWKWGRVDG